MGKLYPYSMTIKVISIAATNSIFGITCIFKLNETIARRSWRNLQINVDNSSILIKEIFNFPFSDVTGQIANIESSGHTATHCQWP
jgi:hypothetical protein